MIYVVLRNTIMKSVLCDFCLTDTATTEIYTYRPTLSLRDALPSYRFGIARGRQNVEEQLIRARVAAHPLRLDQLRIVARLPHRLRMDFRSEEHTSELQSLMRISYAVFCLKKKTYNIFIYTM